MAMIFQEESVKPTHLIRDNDSKYPEMFDEILAGENVKVVRTCFQAPNMNAFMERWMLSLQVECLDRFVVLGEDHFRLLVSAYVSFFNNLRPHQSLGNLPLDGHALDPPPDRKAEQVVCDERLGGVLKSYSWHLAA
ncbi:MAG TPA: integrase core domain-containing protein [Gemmataceae bacterium]|jgi:transposase InsO family protein|nr:integrase core domain-containing protein [Gemmataceae bacterium]